MSVEVREAPIEQKSVLERLLQLYLYDFSEMEGWDIGDDGLFESTRVPLYWTEQERFPFMITVDGKIAGFILVRTCTDDHEPSHAPEAARTIAEFFVLRKFRRGGWAGWRRRAAPAGIAPGGE